MYKMCDSAAAWHELVYCEQCNGKLVYFSDCFRG